MTEIQESTKKKTKKEKKPKKVGPIRTSAVIPLVLIVTGIILFNIFFLDSTVKSVMEIVGSRLNTAQVDVGSVNSSFKDLKFSVTNIQVTNPKEPKFNTIQIGKVQFALSWDALLRAKAVINLAEVSDIKVNTERKSPGKVFNAEEDTSEAEVKAKEILSNTKEEFKGNVFGDVAGVLAGGSTGDVTSDMTAKLESKERFEQLKTEIDQKKSSLTKQLNELPSDKEFKDFEKRFNSIKKDFGNIVKLPKALKEADKLNRDINAAFKKYDDLNKNFNQSIKDIDKSYKEAEALVGKDIAAVKKRMKLPTLDQTSIAKMLFGPEIVGRVEQVKGYQQKIQKYMPPKKEKVEKKKIPRGQGIDYKFGTPKSYPKFWLKLAKISSQNDQGNVQGKLENFSTNQKIINKKALVEIDADFPPQEIKDLKFLMEIDYKEELQSTFNGSIGEFIVHDKALSEGSDATFILKKSKAKSLFKGSFTASNLDMTIDNTFHSIDYVTKAKSDYLAEVLKDVTEKTKELSLDAKVKGKWDSLAFEIKSNLAKAIENSVRGVIQAKINATQNKIRKEIEASIAGTRSQVDSQINSYKSSVQKQIDTGKKQMNDAKKKLENEKKKAEKGALKGLKNPLKGFKL